MYSTDSVAYHLSSHHRQDLAVKMLSKDNSVSQMAREHKVSRPFLYLQKDKAQKALNDAFEPKQKDEEVLYHLPITKKWIFQLILALILICHSSYRGVIEILRDLFNYPISIGTIHNRVKEASTKAQEINQSEDLSLIETAAIDELFIHSHPVLKGVDTGSSYCFLLEEVEHRDVNTWGWYLLEAIERGLDPEYVIADSGKGIKAAHKAIWSDKILQGDVWHIFDQGETLCRLLEKKAQGAKTKREELEAKIMKHNLDSANIKSPLTKKLAKALKEDKKWFSLATDVRILVHWLRLDILSLAGSNWQERMDLMDFVLEELEKLETKARARIKTFRVALSNQKENLLAFAKIIDDKLTNIAKKFEIPLSWVREVCLLHKKPLSTNMYWQKWNQLYQKMSHKFLKFKEAVDEALKSTSRASSLVENLNSLVLTDFVGGQLRARFASGSGRASAPAIHRTSNQQIM